MLKEFWTMLSKRQRYFLIVTAVLFASMWGTRCMHLRGGIWIAIATLAALGGFVVSHGEGYEATWGIWMLIGIDVALALLANVGLPVWAQSSLLIICLAVLRAIAPNITKRVNRATDGGEEEGSHHE